jgi:hypothetical protein
MTLISDVLNRLTGQGERFNEMDELLGMSFDIYTQQVHSAVDSMRGHISDMINALSPSIDTLRTVVDQVEAFNPQSRSS